MIFKLSWWSWWPNNDNLWSLNDLYNLDDNFLPFLTIYWRTWWCWRFISDYLWSFNDLNDPITIFWRSWWPSNDHLWSFNDLYDLDDHIDSFDDFNDTIIWNVMLLRISVIPDSVWLVLNYLQTTVMRHLW